MEIKAKLLKPYTEEQRLNFLVEQNHNKNYEIKETDTTLEAWGYTKEEIADIERKSVQMLSMTKLDFVTSLETFNITYETVKQLINSDSECKKQWELCERVYRFNPMLDKYCNELGINAEQLDEMFKAKGV